MQDCYIALGSNLQSPIQQVIRAYQLLRSRLTICRCSSLYQSSAMVSQQGEIQPDYINAVVQLKTQLGPHQLLTLTQGMERQLGRMPQSKRWQPRIIDIDILWLGGMTINTPLLTLPHPGLLKRPFVLIPLAEINPQFMLPNSMRITDYLPQLTDEWNVRRIDHSLKQCG